MKKGFTLVELLAVFAILAIIALIVVPLVLNIIYDAKISATNSSVKLYAKNIENKLASKALNGNTSKPDSCIIRDGSIDCEGIMLEVEEKNTPEDGIILFKNGRMYAYYVEIDGKSYEYGTTPEECFKVDKTGTLIEYTCEYTDLIIPTQLPLYDISITVTDRDGCINYLQSQSNPEEICDMLPMIDNFDDAVMVYLLEEFFPGFENTINIEYTKADRMVTVTKIPFNRFYKTGLTSVVLPDTITNIDTAAFSYNNISYLKLPANLTTIEWAVFQSNNISKVKIPDGLTSIGDASFEYNHLTSIKIPNSVTEIDSHAFDYNDLKEVTIGSGITSIGSYAFGNGKNSNYGPNKLTSVKINVPSSNASSFTSNSQFSWIDGYTNSNIRWSDSN